MAAAAASDRAWLQAMLEVEAALAAAPAPAPGWSRPRRPSAIAGRPAGPSRFDMAELGARPPPAGNPVVPAGAASCRAGSPAEVAGYVH